MLRKLRRGEIDLLYVSPERVFSSGFLSTMRALPAPGVTLVCIDEAHCVSQWSHNFRPAFMRLRQVLRREWSDARVLALTATATERTAQDVCDSLGITRSDSGMLRVSSSARANINLTVSYASCVPEERVAELVKLLKESPRFAKRSTIVYVPTRVLSDRVTAVLRVNGLNARAYHAGMKPFERAQVQEYFMQDRVRVVVATVAFGMGVDKSNIGSVVHLSLPQSLENLVQETGRAARDASTRGECHVFLGSSDVERQHHLLKASRVEPSVVSDIVKHVFDGCDGKYKAIDMKDLCARIGTTSETVETVLSVAQVSFADTGSSSDSSDHGANGPLLRVLPWLHLHVAVAFRSPIKELVEHSVVVKHFVSVASMQRIAVEGIDGEFHHASILDVVHEAQNEEDEEVDIARVQRELVQLRADRHVALRWIDRRACVELNHTHPWFERISENRDGFRAEFEEKIVAQLRRFEDLQWSKCEAVEKFLAYFAKNSVDECADFESNATQRQQMADALDAYFSCADTSQFTSHLAKLQERWKLERIPARVDVSSGETETK
ncbi:MAG: hypothetical protein MHM6MM_009693 [Cercozoa sp. M6MM]